MKMWKVWGRFILTAATGVLVLTALTCVKTKAKAAKVTLVDKTPFAIWVDHYWREICNGRVTNQGDTIAYMVQATVHFGRGAVVKQLIAKVNLEPGEVGNFQAIGDTVENGHAHPDTPFVSASVTLSWQ